MKKSFSDNGSDLVQLCKKKDAKAQFKLYKLYSKGMYNVAVRMTNDQAVAEDIIQDAFIKAFSEIDKLKNEKAFGGWLKRIVINRCIDVTRKNKMFTHIETVVENHVEVAIEVEESTDPEFVHRCIKKLPKGARQILVLHALEGYKHAEIAQKLDISESTAKTQYFRAKQLLGKIINKSKNETGSRKIFENESVKAGF